MSKPVQQSRYYEYEFWKPDYQAVSEFPLDNEIGLNRYSPFLPLSVSVTLGEGGTPLLPASLGFSSRYGFEKLWIKHEEQNPTGSFKDRESAVVISSAKQQGVESVVVASSGNAAISTAAYCKVAGLRCLAFVPEKTDQSKKELIKLFGAQIKTIPGNYEDVYRYVADIKNKSWNVTSGQNYLRTEGDKTIAYEIWEQLGVPDTVVVPAGNGGCLAGIWRGFLDLKVLGKIQKIPSMIGVQITNAAPLEKALKLGKDVAIVSNPPDSIAEGIVAQESYCSPKAIQAIRESHGAVITVTDQEILEALTAVIEYESFITEPTSAAAFAALLKLPPEFQDKQIICVNTGSGMRMLDDIITLTTKNHR